jgi:hypothetical protein
LGRVGLEWLSSVYLSRLLIRFIRVCGAVSRESGVGYNVT